MKLIMFTCFKRNVNTLPAQQINLDSFVFCRICHDGDSIEKLIDPCECAGSVALIHMSCLEKWLSASNTQHCEICHYKFPIEKKNTPLTLQSLYEWLKSMFMDDPRIVVGDIIFFLFLTPMCVAATYLCGLGAIFYGYKGFWRSAGLMFLSTTLIATYALWLGVTLRFHVRSWYKWCEEHQIIKLLMKDLANIKKFRNENCEQKNGSQVLDDGDAQSVGKWRGEAGLLSTPPDGQFPMQNVGPVKFESPNVPVIFILGGPGSGKVTHCDNLAKDKNGVTHINMTDLLQQYAIGNNMQDFGLLSSKTVAEVLMLEMKMSPSTKTFLVSGYPRNMRDVVEYSEKIQIVNGVILVSWRQEVLERQIHYGAQLGHVVLSLARMELKNFYRNVMPVAEYFDRSGILIEVNGERNPSEVYMDFTETVMRLLRLSDGTTINTAPRLMEAEVEVERTGIISKRDLLDNEPPSSQLVQVNPAKTANKIRKELPSFIWVIGGPGSNKTQMCDQAIKNMPSWIHISVGTLLRSMTSSNIIIHDAISAGEMVSQDIIMQLVEQQVLLNRENDGIVIDGYPRDLNQVQMFQNKFGQNPPLILLDCSKLQLGRGKLDDSVPAFRKRLEIFREITLPMLKTLDKSNRLITVDGDTDVPAVQQEFAAIIHQLMLKTRQKQQSDLLNGDLELSSGHAKSHAPNGLSKNDVKVFSKQDERTVVTQKIRVNKKMMNGVGQRGVQRQFSSKVHEAVNNGARIANGVLKNSRSNVNNNILLNGDANGGQHRLQNGIGQIVDGVSLGLNRVAPAPFLASSNVAINSKNSFKKLSNEIKDYHRDLHI